MRTADKGRGVLEGAFALLEALRQHGDGAGVSELAVACAVPKSTTHRLLEQLTALGAVERRGARYRLGAQLYRLGQAWQPHPGLRMAGRLPLHRLRAATGGSAVLAVMHEEQALTVCSVPGRAEPLVPVRNGEAFPLDTALGQALRGPVRSGAVLDREDVAAGVCCAALPVRLTTGAVVGAVAVVGSVAVMAETGQRLEVMADRVAEAAAALTRALGRSGTKART
ncbi:helix-turn-helix domain-containing protein [Streptomyces sp. NPDC056600]|uniref:helix-turn-helix domain-containing protein n=1 Tax=Streptomyces sp. NPDC056600 TaxID=3345874 RepID=UPI00368C5454